MKFFKKHFTKFIMSFTLAFTCLFVAFGCNTFAYTIDSNGNLVGDNLFDISKLNNNNLLRDKEISSYNVNNEYALIITTVDASDPYTYFANIVTLSSGDYTLSIQSDSTIQQIGLTVNGETNFLHYLSRIESGNVSFTINETTSFGFGIEFYSGTSTIKVMLNKGNTPLEWEPYGVWFSQQNYDYQVNKYDSLLDSIYPFNKDLFSINNVEYNGYDITDDYISDYDYTILFQGNSINFNTRDFDYLPYNISSQGMNHFFMVIIYDKIVTANSLSFKIDLSHTNESFINIRFNLNNDIVTSTGDLDNENSTTFYTEYNTFNFNRMYIDLYISATETQYNHYSSIVSGGTYAEGYSQASSYYSSQLFALSDMISIRDNKIISLNNSIRDLQTAYNTLNQSYENMLNGNNFANLFFTIAETPFASFKQIWNVDFLGVNLAGFVTGILFLGLIIWVIKKIF